MDAGRANLLLNLMLPMQIGPAKGQIVLVEAMPPLFQRTIDGLGIYIVPRADGKDITRCDCRIRWL